MYIERLHLRKFFLEKKMFIISIEKNQVIFSKFFSIGDKDSVLVSVPEDTKRVVFIDTPSTIHLVATIDCLISRGIEVVVRDHHDCPGPRNPREQEIADAANRVRELIGGNATISNRAAHPACSSLIEVGEFFLEGTVIVADPDPDGLTAAVKALGLDYDGLDVDAAVLDGPRSEQTADRLTPLALLLVKGMATLPQYNAERPQIAEEAKGKLFAEFAAAAGGNAGALESLGRKVEAYEEGVRVAETLAAEATQPVAGVVMVDTVDKARYDLGRLAARMEALPGCRITVVHKDSGPIAGKHGGVQISLAVVKAFQAEINLQEFLLPGFVSSPESGIISNTTFLLHVSEEVWGTQVLPALTKRFAA